MIKRQPILKPVHESEHKKQLPILHDLKNVTNKTLKPATKLLQTSTYPTNKDEWDGATSQRVAMREADVGQDDLLNKNKKPAREEVLPSPKEIKKVPGLVTIKESKLEVVGGAAPSELESSFGATEKANIEKEIEALMKRADAKAIKQDEMLEEEIAQDMENDLKEELSEDKQLVVMAAATEGVPDTISHLVLPDALEFELRGIECDLYSGLDELDQGLQGLNMCELRDDLQKLEKQIIATLIQREEESEATDRSFGKGVREEDPATILSSFPPIKPTQSPNKSQDVIANTGTPEAATNPDANKILHYNKPTKLLQKTRHFDS